MTIKEAILKSLEDIGGLTNYNEVYDHIISNGYMTSRKQKLLMPQFLPYSGITLG